MYPRTVPCGGETRADLPPGHAYTAARREPANRALYCGSDPIVTASRAGADLRTLLNTERLIAAVTDDKVREAATEYLRTDNYVRVSLFPEGSDR